MSIARGYRGRGLELDDLVGEGQLGLIRAAEGFAPGYGTRFSTYAAYWIREAIRHALINSTATIRIPAHLIGLLSRCHRVEREVRRERGQAPTAEEVASRLGLTGSQQGMVARARQAGRIARDSGPDGGGAEGIASRPDHSQGPPGSGIEAEEDRRELRAGLARLDEKERAVLAHRYGVGGGDPATLSESGRRMGASREWARKLEIRALGKLGRGRAGGEPASGRTAGATA